ncbi:hypothetical protein V6N11_052459 [Hibiscus sabdariffa]|uniref:RNase H type-1 domain-containing protein n=1 Tax=Hibiscus sabdariffa TaxID=183260 RepID=A0ABR2UAE3_9ROSI
MVETLDPDIFSHNSRKHRRLDDDPPDDGEIRPASAIPPPSYKDSLMKDNVAAIHTVDEIFDDEEIEIQEGDVIRSLVDGIISLISRTAIRLMDIENDYFLVTFKLRSDYLKVLADGPWTIFGHYLTVQQWTPDFTTSIPYPTKEIFLDLLPKPDRVASAEVHDTGKPSDTSLSASDAPLNRDPSEGSIMGDPPDRSSPAAGGQLADRSSSIPVSTALWKALAAAWEDLRSSLACLLDLLDDNGNWDTQQLSALFNNAVIPYILSIRYLDPSDLPDRPIWGMNGKHSFDIKSAYSSLSASSWNVESQKWKTIWSLQVPQHLRVFLWLSFKGKLMTNAERYRRSLCPHPLCPCCESAPESVLHVLRDCRYAHEVWSLLLTPGRHGHFFRGELAEWLHSNVGSHELHPSRGLPWSTLFISTIWQLWKARNDLVFSDVPFTAATLLQRSVLWARYYSETATTAAPAQPPSSNAVHWKLSELGWVCLSTDGAVSLGSGIGSVSSVFRADDGSWISGFNKTIGIVCPLQTELWGILLGLQLAWDNGFERFLIQSDSKEAIKRLVSTQASSDPCSLVRTIDRMCHRGWATEFRWIPREGNKPADMLSKFDNLPNYGVTIFSQPPEALLPLLDFDMLHSL